MQDLPRANRLIATRTVVINKNPYLVTRGALSDEEAVLPRACQRRGACSADSSSQQHPAPFLRQLVRFPQASIITAQGTATI